MAIEAVTSVKPSIGVSLEPEKKNSESTVVAQENADKNSMKAGIDNQKFEMDEGVKRVDINV